MMGQFKTRRIVMIGVVAVLLLATPNLLSAGGPSYLILRQSSARPEGFAATTSRYSYGWFGAGRYRHWTRHNGYFNNYTQWSGR
jgi:hypothetical protein